MSALEGAALALIGFVVTQSILKFILEPIQEQRRLIGEVAHALLFYANVYHIHMLPPPDEAQKQELDAAQKALRDLSSRVVASLWTIPYYNAWALLGRVPKKNDVLEAAEHLRGWSNSLYGRQDEVRHRRRKIIADRLGISKKIGEVD